MELFLTRRRVPRPLVRRILDYHRQTTVRQLSPAELGVVQGAGQPTPLFAACHLPAP